MTEGEHAVAPARENPLTSIFGRPNRVLTGVVHLLPLPGSPDYSGGGVEAIYARALADARAYADAGFHGLIVGESRRHPFFEARGHRPRDRGAYGDRDRSRPRRNRPADRDQRAGQRRPPRAGDCERGQREIRSRGSNGPTPMSPTRG